MKLPQLAKHPLILTILGVGALFVTILLITPYFIDIGIEKWLDSHEQGEALVENVDFNPFTGRLSMDNLVVETARGRIFDIPHASVKFSWKQLIQKHIYLQELIVQNTFLLVDRVEGVGFRIGGLILRELVGGTDQSVTPAWGVGIDHFEMTNSRVEYQTPEFTATCFIDQYTLTGLESWNDRNTVAFELRGRINDSPVHIKTKVVPFDVERSWDGSLSLQKGSLALLSKTRALRLPMTGSIDIDTKLKATLQRDGTLHLTADGNVAIQQLTSDYDNTYVSGDELTWQGKLSSKKLPQKGITFNIAGRFVGKDIEVALPAQGLQIELAGFNLQGETELAQENDTLTVALSAELTGENISIADTERNLTLLEANSFSVQGIHIADLDDISISNIALQKPLLIASQRGNKDGEQNLPSLLHAAAIEISDTTLQDLHNLSISDLLLQDSRFFVARHKDGSWFLIDELLGKPATGHQHSSAPDRTETAGTAMQFFLRKLRVIGNSSVRFEDESFFRPYRTTFLINEFLVTDIDTANKEKPARVSLDGMIGQYGTARLDGTLHLFQKPLSLDIKGKIKALDLPPLSSYTAPTIGYILTSGQLDAKLDLLVDKGKLLGSNDLLMRDLKVKPQDPAKVEEFGKQLDVPLESGLALLRNKRDEVKLNVQLQGNIDNPEFNFQDAINQALAKALKVGAFNYLKYALQPFGAYLAIAQVAGKAGKEITKVRLDPIQFAAGENELDEPAARYLEKVAGILNDRPKLKVEICGKAVAADRTAMRERQIARLEKQKELQKKNKNKVAGEADTAEIIVPDAQLETLAEQRAQLVKETLFSQYGVDHTRMYLCLPEIVTSPESPPLVELLID